MEHINIIGGSSYLGSQRPVGSYGGQYISSGSGLHNGPRRYKTFTNTRWEPVRLPNNSMLRKEISRQNTEQFIPRVSNQNNDCPVPSKDKKYSGECGEVITKILNKFSNDLTSPSVFGPPGWFTYHNGSAHLPEILNPSEQEKIYGFVQGIPLMTPCGVCRPHASKYISEHDDELREAIKTRDGMFEWFVNFHNAVNTRHGKPTLSLGEAQTLYRIDKQCAVSL